MRKMAEADGRGTWANGTWAPGAFPPLEASLQAAVLSLA